VSIKKTSPNSETISSNNIAAGPLDPLSRYEDSATLLIVASYVSAQYHMARGG